MATVEEVKNKLRVVLNNIEEACKKRTPELQLVKPRLVGASKIQPIDSIIAAYEDGLRHFGENYVQELEEKANNPEILIKCKDIKWHLIGHLQLNKINKVLALPNLYLIETVDSQKLASALNTNWPKFGPPGSRLKVMVQVNTSREEAKNGVDPSELCNLTKYVLNECSNLELDGLMTIGKYGYNPADGPNPDFLSLRRCRDDVCTTLGLDWRNVNLSMGMSCDYEQAVELGSTNVRVGTSIFGNRPAKFDAKFKA